MSAPKSHQLGLANQIAYQFDLSTELTEEFVQSLPVSPALGYINLSYGTR